MPEIIGVKFRNGGKVYYFSPGDLEIHYHDHVIVETARGLDYGTVVLPTTDMPEEKVTSPLKPVIRRATKDDEAVQAENAEKEKKAYRICKEKIAEHGLDMKLIQVEYTFDNSKILFYFTADGRIDFRELVKDLAGIFKTRIELRQIGVRDETKLLGGMGICGRPLCCHSWLTDFQPVSIKMAKDQNLSLNPAKISGVCGRLMCCLKNESDTYAYLNKGMPGKGDYVTTKDGMHGEVQSVNILRRSVKVILELENGEKDLQEFNVDDITFVPKGKRPRCQCPVKAQMEAQAAARGSESRISVEEFVEARTVETVETAEGMEVTETAVEVTEDVHMAEPSAGADAGEGGKKEQGPHGGRSARDRSARRERQGRGQRSSEHPERGDRQDRAGRSDRRGRSGRPARGEGREETRERAELSDNYTESGGQEERRGDESRARDRRAKDRERMRSQGAKAERSERPDREPAQADSPKTERSESQGETKRRRRRRPRKRPDGQGEAGAKSAEGSQSMPEGRRETSAAPTAAAGRPADGEKP